MPQAINETHDPNLKSWVESANDPNTDFPIQNLPFCWFEEADVTDPIRRGGRVGVRVGEKVLDLAEAGRRGMFAEFVTKHRGGRSLPLIFEVGTLRHMGMSAAAGLSAREVTSRFLTATPSSLDEKDARAQRVLLDPDALRFFAPESIGNYTDFYASIHHATNVGSMFRPDQPLLPNYKWIPIAYHGRASSIVPSGTVITRPRGQTKADDAAAPSFGPSRMLDYELEVGFVIGRGSELSASIPIDEAEDRVFGLCLVNDWSARDIQKWEYQPLGPFLAKNFATSVSPYIVTMEALAPFRCPAFKRAEGDPRPLPHLFSERDQASGGIDITLEVYLASEQMRQRGLSPVRLSRGNFRDMYWTISQMVAHHASGGCNLQSGDLLASGTVSGPTPEARGCLLELTWDGPGKPRKPIELPSGERRFFLEDGDEVIFKAYCERDGFRRIGFGECRGVISPSR